MKMNKWTLGLAAVGVVSLASVASAEEKMSVVQTALSSTTLSGYVDTAAHWNFGTGNNVVPGYAWNSPSKADGFNLNVVKLTLEKPLDETQYSAGYKVDLLFGPDANLYNTQSITSQANGDFAIKQAYIALRVPVGNGIDFKVGVFDAIVGYESFDAGNNPNYTRSYGYTIEPLSHTGVLATYKATDWLSLSAGVANTMGPTINEKAYYAKAESYKTYMGSIALVAPKDWGWLGGSALYGGVVNGFNTSAGGVSTSWYGGATINTPLTGLRLGVAYDYAGMSPQTYASGNYGGSSYANAVGAYASFQATEKLSLHARGEYSSATSGYYAQTSGGWTFIPKQVVALTGTVQYDLWANVVSRLEFRWDHNASGQVGSPYGTSPDISTGVNNAFLLAANFIYKF
jgi:hypothetical protein